MKLLKIGGFELPAYASFDLTQRYEPIGGETILRAISGRGILQRTWRRTRVVTSGSGWVPSGIQSLDFDTQHEIACIAPETVPADFVTRQVGLSGIWRNDAGHVPYGLAQLPSGQTVAAGVTMNGEVATVGAVADAVAYHVGFYPVLTCWLLRPTRSGPDHSWELVAEEV